MAAYQDKVLVNAAITDNTKLDLSHVHVTSANFQQLSPIYNKEMVPGETLKCGIESFSRMNPLVVPTFGRANIKNSAYFVPFRTVFRGWNDFITDSPHANSADDSKNIGNILTTVPYFTNDSLVTAFLPAKTVSGDTPFSANTPSSEFSGVTYEVLGGAYNASYEVSAGTPSYDFALNWNNTARYFKFTFVGRQILKVVESLGYKVNWNISDTTKFSALPLLCWSKVYVDWYFPQDYTNTDIYNYLLMLCNSDTGTSRRLYDVDLGRILQFVYTCYDSDYFVSAWDHPNSPNTGTYSGDFKITNIDTIGQVYGPNLYQYKMGQNGVSNNNGSAINNGDAIDRYGNMDAPFITLYMNGTSTTGGTPSPITGGISEYLLHGLHALTDYMKRHQLAGSAAFQRYLSRFGKALDSEKLNRSIFLGTDVIPIQIGDVMSTSKISQSGFDGLGEYAGKGIAYGQAKDFEYTTDEYGMFIVVSSIIPSVGYYQGLDRNVKHLTKLDFYTPEFDSLGVQPITADELYMSFEGDGNFGSSDIHTQIFGFTPRYAEYKKANDQVTGILRVPSLNGIRDDNADFLAERSWHLMRSFDDDDFGGAVSGIVHSVDFCYARNDYGDYNRIFPNASKYAPDQFTLIHNFNVVSYSPMKSLYDTYEFEDEGKKVMMQANGVIKN